MYILKSGGDRTTPCGTRFMNWRCVDVLFLNVVYVLQCSLCVSMCMLTVSNALLMSSATVIVRFGGLFWLKPVAMVLFMLCSAVLVGWWPLKPCCVGICGMLFFMYGSSVISSIYAITKRSGMGLYDVHMFMSLFGFGIGMMFSKFTCVTPVRDDVV